MKKLTKLQFLLTLTTILFISTSLIINDLGIFNEKIHQKFLTTEVKMVQQPSLDRTNYFVENPLMLTGKTFIGFKEALAHSESRGNYFIVSRYGYMGKYQFGKSALKFYGVNDFQAFLNSPEQQEKIFSLSLKRNKWVLRNEIAQFSGKKIQNIEITESGILAAAHLVGAHNVKQYFKSKGQYAFSDGNGVSLEKYLKKFAGYDLAHITPEKNPKFIM